jgi:hypothetical protein
MHLTNTRPLHAAAKTTAQPEQSCWLERGHACPTLQASRLWQQSPKPACTALCAAVLYCLHAAHDPVMCPLPK